MIKYVCTAGAPSWAWARYLCHANFECLDTRHGALSREVFNAISQDIWLDGVWRWSRRGRLPITERTLAERLAPLCPAGARVLDLGASDGTTTLDLLAALRERVPGPVTVLLTDRFLRLERWRSGGLMEYRTPQGLPVLLRWGRLAMRLPRSEHWWDHLGSALARWWVGRPRRARFELDGELSLVHPDALAEPALEPRVVDVTARDEVLVGTLDAVRAANILNHGYFRPEQLSAAVGHIHAYLRPGGLLTVVRSEGPRHDETECGTLWQRADDHFERLGDWGTGSEIAAIVDAWRA